MMISEMDEDTKTEYSLSVPFSWRGSYNEVAFSIETRPSNKQELMKEVGKAYEGIFTGWKGGDYRYGDYTPVNEYI